jgi:metal-responsive CopG/Arc/MetJ family transcriptional regulator
MAKTISLRIEEKLLLAVDTVVIEDERKGRSEVICQAVTEWLKRRALAEKVQRHREGYTRHPVLPDEFPLSLDLRRG